MPRQCALGQFDVDVASSSSPPEDRLVGRLDETREAQHDEQDSHGILRDHGLTYVVMTCRYVFAWGHFPTPDMAWQLP